jgi:hypothetical protein
MNLNKRFVPVRISKSIIADAMGGVVLTVFVTAVLVLLHAQGGGDHGIVNFLGSAELPVVASVLTLDSLREAIGSIYDGEHRQNIFVFGIIVFVVALLLAAKGVDIEVARHHALEQAVLSLHPPAIPLIPTQQWLHDAELSLPLPPWLVPANMLVWLAAIAVSIWNRILAIGEKRHYISMENVDAFVRLLNAEQRGDPLVRALLQDERATRAVLQAALDNKEDGHADPQLVVAAKRRHAEALQALQMCLKRDVG